MRIAKRQVITIAPTTPVHEAIKIMVKEGFRRIPIADPGTKKLSGIVTATDIVNYLGGGEIVGPEPESGKLAAIFNGCITPVCSGTVS